MDNIKYKLIFTCYLLILEAIPTWCKWIIATIILILLPLVLSPILFLYMKAEVVIVQEEEVPTKLFTRHLLLISLALDNEHREHIYLGPHTSTYDSTNRIVHFKPAFAQWYLYC